MRNSRLTFLAVMASAGLIATAGIGVAADEDEGEAIAVQAAAATITIDGDSSDWADIEPTTVLLEQLDLSRMNPADAEEIEFDAVDPFEATLKVANDAENIYVLFEVPLPYDYVAEDHRFSPALAVQFNIDPDAAEHMGVEEADMLTSLGMVDIWHWELDCGPGELSGGQGVAGGNDEACNLDDEYSTTPERREDDGGGDVPNEAAENSLVGSWSHSAAEIGGDGTWTFEFSRPLQTGDPQDAQFAAGEATKLALAWWDPNESEEGWSDAGHLTTANQGWIEVTLS